MLLCVVAVSFTGKAQLKDTFDNNSWQWKEYATDNAKAHVIDGVLRIETKMKDKNSSLRQVLDKIVEYNSSYAYLPLDPSKGFTVSCEALVDKINDEKLFGLILDYKDDMNCMVFVLTEDWAFLYKLQEGKIVSKNKNQFKLPKQKKARVNIEVQYYSGELIFRVNDIQALKCKFIKLDSSGFGFFAFGDMKVEFDNVEIKN